MAERRTRHPGWPLPEESMSAVENIKRQIEDVRKRFSSHTPNHFVLKWFEQIEILECERLSDKAARMVYRFPVQVEYLNPSAGLHGGAQATFFDIGTSLLPHVIAKPGFWTAHVSRTLNVTYLRPPVAGDVIRMECETVHVGKRLCLLKGTMMRESDGAVISTCEHNKYNLAADQKL